MRQYLLLIAALLPLTATAQSNEVRSLDEVNAQANMRPVGYEPLPTPPETVDGALKEMADQAAIIFVGEVIQIRRKEGVVEIDWHVEEAVCGVVVGTTFTQREWSGLWAGEAARYEVGQHSLLMLHAPSAAGFSSPVSGMDGVLPVRGNAISGTVDLRWMATHIVRGERSASSVGLQAVRPMASLLQRQEIATAPTMQNENISNEPDGTLERPLVMDMLKAWTLTGAGQ